MSLTTSYTSSSTPVSPVGDLTTAWTPPSFCSNAMLSLCGTTTLTASESEGQVTTICSYVERDLTCGFDGVATRASDCFPDNIYPYQAILYSPAVACPVGWTTDVRTLDPAGSTTVTCCPSGFTANNYHTSCVSTISYPSSSTVVDVCMSDGSISETTLSLSSGYSPYITQWAQAIQLALVPASETARVIAQDVSSSSTSNPTAAADPAILQSSSGKRKKKFGLGTGAIVGIVVGVLALLALVGALLFIRRRKRGQPMPGAAKNVESNQALPEYVGGEGVIPGPYQMTTTSSTGLFQPQPELHDPSR